MGEYLACPYCQSVKKDDAVYKCRKCNKFFCASCKLTAPHSVSGCPQCGETWTQGKAELI